MARASRFTMLIAAMLLIIAAFVIAAANGVFRSSKLRIWYGYGLPAAGIDITHLKPGAKASEHKDVHVNSLSYTGYGVPPRGDKGHWWRPGAVTAGATTAGSDERTDTTDTTSQPIVVSQPMYGVPAPRKRGEKDQWWRLSGAVATTTLPASSLLDDERPDANGN